MSTQKKKAKSYSDGGVDEKEMYGDLVNDE